MDITSLFCRQPVSKAVRKTCSFTAEKINIHEAYSHVFPCFFIRLKMVKDFKANDLIREIRMEAQILKPAGAGI